MEAEAATDGAHAAGAPEPAVQAEVAEVAEVADVTEVAEVAKVAEPPAGVSDGNARPAAPRAFLRRMAGRGAAGAQQASRQRPAGEAGLLPFLRGTGTDFDGRRLEEILAWDFRRMERCHDYVQWIFPTDEASRFNMRAPLLTPELRRSVRGDAAAMEGIQRSLQTFCAFLGLELLREGEGDPPPVIVHKAAHFEERVQDCWRGGGPLGTGGNHNWLRISRVLHCLRLVGLDEEAAALLVFLEGLPRQGIRCSPALAHWRKRAATEVASHAAVPEE
mmetsp:Transcript_77131/g.249644  ORF Transcript_77131/g.249644 Transcript_77131/m.249644 type:complete len:276 (-) Transcript_77131:69-896(-)